MIDCHTCHVACKITNLICRQDKRTGIATEQNPMSLKHGDGGMIELTPMKSMVVESFSEFPPLGRFAMRDSHRVVGVGIVKSVKKKSNQKASPPQHQYVI